jgi:nucleoside phosphorylase
MAKVLGTSDALHPARLLVSAAVSAADFAKKFQPSISNTPALPAVNWDAIGHSAPQLLNTPSSLPAADAVVVTWAEPEWAALQQVFCSSGTAMPYSQRNTGSWSGRIKYTDGAPSGLGYWGYYRLVQIGTARVLLFKSLTNRLTEYVKPALILSIGTAGGTRTTDPIGTVNVVHTDVLYESNQPQNSWPSYASTWKPDWTVIGNKSFGMLLFPIPTTASDIQSIAAQFNKFYETNYPLGELNPGNLNMGASVPAINNLTAAGTALVTAKSFVVGNTSGNLASFACVEMDDAVIAMAAAGKTAFGSVRNISDPIQNFALPDAFQGHWGEAIYTAYGIYTSYNGAIAAWAVLNGELA